MQDRNKLLDILENQGQQIVPRHGSHFCTWQDGEKRCSNTEVVVGDTSSGKSTTINFLSLSCNDEVWQGFLQHPIGISPNRDIIGMCPTFSKSHLCSRSFLGEQPEVGLSLQLRCSGHWYPTAMCDDIDSWSRAGKGHKLKDDTARVKMLLAEHDRLPDRCCFAPSFRRTTTQRKKTLHHLLMWHS